MDTRSLFSAVVAAVVLAGCGTSMQPAGFLAPPPPCAEAVCKVKISVANCTIDARPETIEIVRDGRTHVIQWEIDFLSGPVARHKFAGKGIEIDPDQFTPANRENFVFTLVDKNDRPGKYKYTINLLDFNGKPCDPKDPWVVNL